MKMDRKGKSLFQRIIPKFIRKPINDRQVKKTILNYYDSLPKTLINEEEKVALDYLRKNKLCVFPYEFQHKYKRKDISVYKDDKLKLKYILFEGKRLYFKRSSSARGIRRNYNALLIEQDLNSAHRYLTDSFNVGEDDIFVDVGAAEGNLAISVIDKIKKVYLFETDANWIEALTATFSPWKDKVEIINKFVSDKNDETNVSLNQFFKEREAFSFLKIDAEGAEDEILNGCEALISSNRQLKLALCCYHKPNDDKKFNEFLVKRGFSVSFSQGYMIYKNPETFSPPYLRRGIARAVKKNYIA
jgi:hypothetical protein